MLALLKTGHRKVRATEQTTGEKECTAHGARLSWPINALHTHIQKKKPSPTLSLFAKTRQNETALKGAKLVQKLDTKACLMLCKHPEIVLGQFVTSIFAMCQFKGDTSETGQ